MSVPRGIRNNNPLNIRWYAINNWVGQVGKDEAGFCIFDKPENGLRAAFILLRKGPRTVKEIVERWAPPSENDTQAYIYFVCKRLGVRPDEYIGLTVDDTMVALAKAIVRFENGAGSDTPSAWYDDTVYYDALALAKGKKDVAQTAAT